jgi:exodeoxyribonuclease-5
MTTTTTVDLDREQQFVLDGLRADCRRQMLQVVDGCAGSGKTTVLERLARELSNWAVVAFTGRATAVLQERGIARARTIHSSIYFPTYGSDGRVSGYGRLPTPVGNPRGFLIDEGNLVGRELFADLRGYHLPIIVFGDANQLSPVRDNPLGLLDHANYRLNHPHRNAGKICHFSQYLLQGGRPERFPDLGREVQLVDRYDQPDADICVVAFNKSRVEHNQRVRRQLGRRGSYPEVNDRVMVLMNARRLGLFNGSQGVVLAVDSDRDTLDLRLEDGRVVEGVAFDYRFFDFPDHQKLEVEDGRLPIDFAYAVTCHKAAGGEWSRVLVKEQICKHWSHTRWSYTSASRAKRRLFWQPCR